MKIIPVIIAVSIGIISLNTSKDNKIKSLTTQIHTSFLSNKIAEEWIEIYDEKGYLSKFCYNKGDTLNYNIRTGRGDTVVYESAPIKTYIGDSVASFIDRYLSVKHDTIEFIYSFEDKKLKAIYQYDSKMNPVFYLTGQLASGYYDAYWYQDHKYDENGYATNGTVKQYEIRLRKPLSFDVVDSIKKMNQYNLTYVEFKREFY